VKILLVGGGSGGHLTPLFAVRDAILKKSPNAKLEIWTDKKMLPAAKARIQTSGNHKTRIRKATSGKYRRYVLVKTPFRDRIRNFFDIFRFIFGIIQSFCRLLIRKPDIIFLKGGFVSVPAGLAARALRIPYIIHESDADLGLANRLLAKSAKFVALGLPPASDNPPKNVIYTGVPIDTAWLQSRRIQKTGTPSPAKPGVPSLVILGGGLGAHRLNLEAIKLAKHFGRKVAITAFIGQSESGETEQELNDLGVTTYRFMTDAYDLSKIVSSADVVVSRSGATAIAELAAASRAVIFIAKSTLPGGHQQKNIDILVKNKAAISHDGDLLHENKLPLVVEALLNDPKTRRTLGANLHKLGRYDAADQLADLLLGRGGK